MRRRRRKRVASTRSFLPWRFSVPRHSARPIRDPFPPLGAGGMGEVYRATRHGRWAARLRSDPARHLHRRSRTGRSFPARSAGARGAESSAHRRHLRTGRERMAASALVLELVEGRERSTDRIARGPIPVDDALAHRATDRRSARGCPRARASSTAISSRPTSRFAGFTYVRFPMSLADSGRSPRRVGNKFYGRETAVSCFTAGQKAP